MKGFPGNCLATFENTLGEAFAMMKIDPRSEFDALGVPWGNVVAFVGHTPPEDAGLYGMIHAKGASCMIGTSRNLDLQFTTQKMADLKPLEAGYRAFLERGADLIETDLPAPLGPMLYGTTPAPPATKAFFHTR